MIQDPADGEPISDVGHDLEWASAFAALKWIDLIDLGEEACPACQAPLLPDGSPVSGRLNAVLYFDIDDSRASGLSQGSADLRTGCERRLEIGAIAMGADAEEQRKATVVVGATLWSLTSEGRRRTLWRVDDEAEPKRVSAHGEWIELRIPADRLGAGPRLRIVLASGDRLTDGRLEK